MSQELIDVSITVSTFAEAIAALQHHLECAHAIRLHISEARALAFRLLQQGSLAAETGANAIDEILLRPEETGRGTAQKIKQIFEAQCETLQLLLEQVSSAPAAMEEWRQAVLTLQNVVPLAHFLRIFEAKTKEQAAAAFAYSMGIHALRGQTITFRDESANGGFWNLGIRRNDAIDYLEQAVALDSSESAHHLALGIAFLYKKQYDDALLYFENAMALDAAAGQGNYIDNSLNEISAESAPAVIAKCETVERDGDFRPRKRRACALLAQKEFQLALNVLMRYLEQCQHDAQAYCIKTEALRMNKGVEREVLETPQQRALRNKLRLAWAAAEATKAGADGRKSVIKHAMAALELDPGNAEAIAFLAEWNK